MMLPIIVYEHGDVMFFDSIDTAERYIEPVDVNNREYTAYDRLGRQLELSLTSDGLVAINLTRPVIEKSKELREILQRLLVQIGESEMWAEEASLPELIKIGAEVFRTE